MAALIENTINNQFVQSVLTSDELQSLVEAGNETVTSVLEHQTVLQAVQQGSQLINNYNLRYFLGGLAVGAYFGFRIGAVSNRAKALVENTEWMKAATVNSYDGIQGITVQNVEVPRVLGDKDVLIRVKAASLDPIDIKVSQGYGRGLRELVNKYNPNTKRETFPIVLGRDGTGVVSEVGSEVHHLAPGDRVWFIVPPCYQGSLSSFLLLSSEYIRPLPTSLSFESGATLPYTSLVVWDLLVTSGGLGPYPASKGKRVFIWGGVRAVERLCVQLCKVWGCDVTCVAPVYTQDYLRTLGASHLIPDDMKSVRELIQQGNRFDVVVNTGGLLAEDLCLSLLSSEGRVVSTLTATPGLPEYGLFTSILARLINSVVGLFQRNLLGEERVWIETKFRGEVLEYISDLVDQGLIDPVGERIFSMDQVELAFRSLAGGGHKGKLVIRMEQDSYSSLSKQLRIL